FCRPKSAVCGPERLRIIVLFRGGALVTAQTCCHAVSSRFNRTSTEKRIATGGPRPRGIMRRVREIAGWILSGGVLALLPKCPACLAAYFSIGTGIGISMSAATYLRMLLVALCVISLSYLT